MSYLPTLLLTTALVMASAGLHAQETTPDAVDRNTGIGKVIAAQGNAALEAIRDELGETLLTRLEPAYPAPLDGPVAALPPLPNS